ncbi:MAG: glutathione S-transferase family protein [Pseudomonadota bacterium]
MKLYVDPGSGSCRRVSAVIETLGMNVEEVYIDLLSGANRTPAFLAINPNGMVPVLVDGDLVLWEAAAIMIYICEKSGDTRLLPTGNDRYEVLRWMFWAAEHFRQAPPMLLEERLFSLFVGQAADETRIAEAQRRIERFAPILDAHLEHRNYVVGDSITLADFDLAAPLSHMARANMRFDAYPNIIRWKDRLEEEISAWKKVGDRLHERMDKAITDAGIILAS